MDKVQPFASASSDILNRLRSEIDDVVALIGRPITLSRPCAITRPAAEPATILPFEAPPRPQTGPDFDPVI